MVAVYRPPTAAAGTEMTRVGFHDAELSELPAARLNAARAELRLTALIDSGWPGDNYELTQAMAAALSQRGYRMPEDFLHLVFPHAQHDERAWGGRLYLPLQLGLGKAALDELASAPADPRLERRRLLLEAQAREMIQDDEGATAIAEKLFPPQ